MIIPDGFGQVNLMFTGIAVPTGAEVTFGLEYGVPFTAAEVADAVATAVDESDLLGVMTTAITLSNIHVKSGPNLTGASADLSQAVTGAFGENAVPPNTSMIVRKLTSAGGRSGRGRLFLPGLREDQVNGSGQWDSTLVEAVTGCWETIRTELDEANLNTVLLHGADAPISIPTLITSFAADATAATQRQRLRR